MYKKAGKMKPQQAKQKKQPPKKQCWDQRKSIQRVMRRRSG